MLHPIGTRIRHSGHGLGTIVDYNGRKAGYTAGNLGTAEVGVAVAAGLGPAVIDSFYDGSRYPYIIQFDSGYKDFYSETDVTAA